MINALIRKTGAAAAVVATVLGMPAQADPLDNAYSAQILPGWRMADGRHMAALEIRLAPGWKTYWRAPGDAGIPPQFDWRGSRNLADVAVIWPTPKVMDQGGFQVIGYTDRLIIPLEVHPGTSGRAVHLKTEVDLGVCKEVCLPATVQVDQMLEAKVTKPDAQIAGALANKPYSRTEAGVGDVTCSISQIEDGLRLTASVEMPKIRGREVAVIETDNAQLWVSQAKTSRSGNRLTAVSDVYHVEGRSFALDRNGVRITVIGSSHAVDIQGCTAG